MKAARTHRGIRRTAALGVQTLPVCANGHDGRGEIDHDGGPRGEPV